MEVTDPGGVRSRLTMNVARLLSRRKNEDLSVTSHFTCKYVAGKGVFAVGGPKLDATPPRPPIHTTEQVPVMA